MEAQITNIDRLSGNDLTSEFTMKYRLESDPDIPASYTTVTTTKTICGITFPYFDTSAMPTGIYVVHTYFTSSGDTTGTKITIEITASV